MKNHHVFIKMISNKLLPNIGSFKPRLVELVYFCVLFCTSVLLYFSSGFSEKNDWILSKHDSDVYSICASIIAAYVFHLINTVLPKYNENKFYKELVRQRVGDVLKESSRFVFMINTQAACPEKILFPVLSYDAVIESSEGLKIHDTYKRSVKVNPIDGKPIHYPVFDMLKETTQGLIEGIEKLRAHSLIKEHELLVILEDLEAELKKSARALSILEIPGSANHPLSPILLKSGYEVVFYKSKKLMKYYNDNLKRDEHFSDFDLWFNPSPIESSTSDNINSILTHKRYTES